MSFQCLVLRLGVIVGFVFAVGVIALGVFCLLAGMACVIAGMIALLISPPPATLPIVGVLVVMFIVLEVISLPLILIGGLGLGASMFASSAVDQVCPPVGG